MSSETPNPATPEADQEQTSQESPRKDIVDVEDLVMKGRSVLDPAEIGSNPAIAPETVTLNDPSESKEGFKFDREKD